MPTFPKKATRLWSRLMGKTELNYDERILWLRFVLNPSLPQPDIHDWQGLLDFADRQAIIGVCEPSRFCSIRPNVDVLFEWIGAVEQIKGINDLLNRKTAILFHQLKEAGFRCCILKGQGNGTLYPDGSLRTPGDIDVWVDTDRVTLLDHVKTLFPDEKETFKHIKFPVFNNIDVDLHYTPLKLYHPVHNKRLQRWIQENKEEQMTHSVRLPHTDTDVAIPTAVFNAVYQMGHIMIHIEEEGIGLRQMVDYYYVLVKLGGAKDVERKEIVNTWESLGMKNLSRAVMWFEHVLLGLPEEYLLSTPHERWGRMLATDILEGGNFGQYSGRQGYRKYGRYVKKCVDTWHLVRLSACFPGEAFFRFIRKIAYACKLLF